MNLATARNLSARSNMAVSEPHVSRRESFGPAWRSSFCQAGLSLSVRAFVGIFASGIHGTALRRRSASDAGYLANDCVCGPGLAELHYPRSAWALHSIC
jgi:hypothetical protein